MLQLSGSSGGHTQAHEQTFHRPPRHGQASSSSVNSATSFYPSSYPYQQSTVENALPLASPVIDEKTGMGVWTTVETNETAPADQGEEEENENGKDKSSIHQSSPGQADTNVHSSSPSLVGGERKPLSTIVSAEESIKEVTEKDQEDEEKEASTAFKSTRYDDPDAEVDFLHDVKETRLTARNFTVQDKVLDDILDETPSSALKKDGEPIAAKPIAFKKKKRKFAEENSATTEENQNKR